MSYVHNLRVISNLEFLAYFFIGHHKLQSHRQIHLQELQGVGEHLPKILKKKLSQLLEPVEVRLKILL